MNERLLRRLAALANVPILVLCGFGFLATFEPLAGRSPWPWRIGYALVFLGSLVCIVRFLRPKR